MSGMTISNPNVKSLFSSLNTNSANSGIYNSLSDMSSLKTGSYKKLLQKYYNTTDGDVKKTLGNTVNKNSISTSKANTEELGKLKTNASDLKSSTKALRDADLFAEKDGKVDTDKVYDALNKYVKDYNSLLDKAEDATSSSIRNTASNMVSNTKVNEKMLNNIGIKVDSENKLSIDKDAFEKSDMSKVQSLFGSNGSYGYQVETNASMIDYAAQNEAAKANTYNNLGAYSYNYNAGSLFNYGL